MSRLITNEKRKEIFDGYKKGLSTSALAHHVELPYRTIRTAIKSKWFSEMESAFINREPEDSTGEVIEAIKEPVIEKTLNAAVIKEPVINEPVITKTLNVEQVPIDRKLLQDILFNTKTNKPVKKEHNDIVSKLLRFHPNPNKLTNAVRYADGNFILSARLRPSETDAGRKSKCFHFRKEDGTYEDISYIKCLKQYNHKKRMAKKRENK